MNPIDRAHAVLRHAEKHALGDSLGSISYLQAGDVHVQVHSGLAPLIAWTRSLPGALINVSPHKGAVHVMTFGDIGPIHVIVVSVVARGPEFEFLTAMAVTGLIEPDQLQRFVHEEVV